MAALWNRAGHYIFALWFLLLSSSSFFFPCLISAAADWVSTILPHMVWPYCEFKMQLWNVLHVACWKYRMQKIAKNSPSGHHCTAISSQLRHISTIGKKLVKQQYLPHMSLQYGELSLLAAEVVSLVWGTPANFNRFRVLAVLLHGTLVVDVCQTLRCWTEGATYIRQGGHRIGHWPTF